ncbi:hypothetical protein IFM89_019994, partial [Coptis chinensis]
VVHDVDRQKVPVRFAISSAGLVGSDGPMLGGAFDITFMSCLPNMIVMAPTDEVELVNMVVTAAHIGKGRVLVEGKDVALLGYGVMVQNCLRARSLLASLDIHVIVADARFCKPLDIKLVKELCKEHTFFIIVEEGSVGGFVSHIVQFIALDGKIKVMVILFVFKDLYRILDAVFEHVDR